MRKTWTVCALIFALFVGILFGALFADSGKSNELISRPTRPELPPENAIWNVQTAKRQQLVRQEYDRTIEFCKRLKQSFGMYLPPDSLALALAEAHRFVNISNEFDSRAALSPICLFGVITQRPDTKETGLVIEGINPNRNTSASVIFLTGEHGEVCVVRCVLELGVRDLGFRPPLSFGFQVVSWSDFLSRCKEGSDGLRLLTISPDDAILPLENCASMAVAIEDREHGMSNFVPVVKSGWLKP